MGLFDRPALKRLAEAAEDNLGVALRAPERVRELEAREQEFVAFANDVESLGLYGFDYFGGRPQEMLPERRKRIAQRSRRALLEDPLAGAEAQILADFGFGKGVSTPTARDPQVQEVIDAAWSDANNQDKLTSYAAQRKLSNELLTAGELFITLYEQGGRIRVGRRSADRILNVVTDPEDENRPLYYLEQIRKYEWDFATDQPKITDEQQANGRVRVRYWPHWRNVDDAEEERQLGTSEETDELPTPPADKLAKGRMYHVAINQTGDQLRGNPPWMRTLRFFTAMNLLTESHVTMAQAASTFIARRVMKASPRQLTKQVNAVIAQASELGAGRAGFGTSRHRYGDGADVPFGAGGQEPATRGFAPTQPPPFAPGSWWNENESSRLEALNLNSGAGQMAQSAQIVRAPIAAAAQFGQHYLGDASDANLATASTLELPATMRIVGWQQWFEETLRWFTDRAIEAAAKAGLLGGNVTPDDDSIGSQIPLSAMKLDEAQDRAAMEDRTGKDLSYEFVMPFPGRRQLTDVTTFVTQLAESYDPNGVAKDFRRTLLRFAYEQIGIDDVAHAVEEAIPDKSIPGGIGSGDFAPAQPPPMLPPGAPGSQNGNGAAAGQDGGAGAYGARAGGSGTNGADGNTTGTQSASEAEWIPPELRAGVRGYTSGVADLFEKVVGGAALAATRELTRAGAED